MKNILITGASRGIGKATLKLLAEEGYFVYGIYNENKEVAKELKSELDNVKFFQCDFSDRDNVFSLISELNDIDFYGLIHSAGIFVDVDFDNLDLEAWDNVLNVNFFAPLIISQQLKDNLEEGGSIVNISSTDAMVGADAGMAYSASKAALVNLTKSLANVFSKKNIRVNNVAPGWIGDGMQSPGALLEEAANLNPLRRVGDYNEIANIISFLISNKSSYINGETIVADGGDNATNYILQKESEILSDD